MDQVCEVHAFVDEGRGCRGDGGGGWWDSWLRCGVWEEGFGGLGGLGVGGLLRLLGWVWRGAGEWLWCLVR